MKKFFLLTRGRTGSTAILDEIGTTNILAVQEPFINLRADISNEIHSHVSQNMIPFDLWVENFCHRQNHGIANTFKTALYKRHNLPLSDKWAFGRVVTRYLIQQYLKEMESVCNNFHKEGIIVKVLSHQLTERKPLLGVLKSSGYRALLLVRRNVVRQVLSGMVAEFRRVYNSKERLQNQASCKIDLDRFEYCVAWEMRCVEENRALLRENEINYLEITYEDFCSNRTQFYLRLFSYMQLEYRLPDPTGFSIMIPNIREAIANYDELETRVSSMFSLS